ncbi:MAG: diguanylate cyclase [Ramlibacter sp.]|nr:diguanylate cyclase [Ramlibacter sp.]
MRSPKQIWSTALLWLIGLTLAHAQGLNETVRAPPPAIQPIELGPQTQTVPLDGRSLYWIDPTRQATADQVEAAGDTLPWAIRERNRQYNIDDKALWFRFDTVAHDDGRWYLELASSGLNRAQLFYRREDGRWAQQEAGASRAVSEWPLPGRVPTFELDRLAGKRVRYYVRVEQTRVDFAAPVAIYNQRSLLAVREREQFLLGAYFGLAALIAFVTFANAIVNRDRNFGTYGVYVVVLALGQLAYLGVGAQHLWDGWLRWNGSATFVLPGMTTAAALWFARTVTEPARFSRVLDTAVWTLIAAVLGAVAVDTLVQSRASFALLLALTVLGLVLGMLLIGLVWAEGADRYIRLIALGFLPVVIMAMFPVARGLNLSPANVLTRYGLPMGAALQMPILFYALTLRGSRRREADVRSAALSRTDAMTGLAHDRSLLQRLESSLARCSRQKHSCALLAIKLVNWDGIVGEFGRDAGERSLVVTASILRSTITDIDLAARVGNHEFMLLLEAPTTAETANECAQQVIARGLQHNQALPPTVTLRYNVAVAMLPDKEFDAAGSIKWLRDAVNAMLPEARRQIRPLNF